MAGILRRHHLTVLLAVAFAGHLAGLLIVARVMPMVLSVAVAGLAAEQVEVVVVVVFAGELVAE